jgi:hypothetical protein
MTFTEAKEYISDRIKRGDTEQNLSYTVLESELNAEDREELTTDWEALGEGLYVKVFENDVEYTIKILFEE